MTDCASVSQGGIKGKTLLIKWHSRERATLGPDGPQSQTKYAYSVWIKFANCKLDHASLILHSSEGEEKNSQIGVCFSRLRHK